MFWWGVQFIDSNIGTIVGWDYFYIEGTICRTTDGGSTWVIQLSNIDENLYEVSFTDAEHGTVVGDYGIIFNTTNAGNTWTNQRTGSLNPFYSIFCIDERTALVVGYEGIIYKTTNGGEEWISQISHGIENLRDIFFIDNNIGFIVGGHGKIMKTTNCGNNWIDQVSGWTGELRGVVFTDSIKGIAIGVSGKILRTTDGGNNWINQISGTTLNLCDLSFINPNTGIIAGGDQFGGAGIILKTSDGGLNWSSVWSGATTLRGVSYINESNSIVVGENGSILRTTNSGTTWNFQSSGTNFNLDAVSFTDSVLGTVVGGGSFSTGGIILRTTDGGLNWSKQLTISKNLYDIKCINEKIGFAVGDYGTILKTINGGIVTEVGNFSNFTQLTPESFLLSQNYPNPFNPTTKIKFSVPSVETHRDASLQVKLIVFDILGNEVATLMDEQKPAGTYEVEFRGTALPSGIYFYQLRAVDPSTGSRQGFVETKKMVLMK